MFGEFFECRFVANVYNRDNTQRFVNTILFYKYPDYEAYYTSYDFCGKSNQIYLTITPGV